MVVGSASFPDRMRSPAWSLLRFAAPVGYSTSDPFGVVVESGDSSTVQAHVLICAPQRKRIIEAWKRRADGVWVERQYAAPTRSTVEKLAGPVDLDVIMSSTERRLPTEGSNEFRAAVEVLEGALPLA